ncbi:MAG: ABC transporter permease [Firmicutes bacterium]|nr:ABC transporter permease [Bacillota bacterium]
MNIFQSVKMAWRSIMAKKGRSVLTMLSIFIGIASVMSIVSVMEGMKDFTRAQYAAMGTNVVNVSIYSWSFDEDGNSNAKDYFPDLYNFCGSIKEYVDGVTPNGYASATVTYGTKTTANMEYKWDEQSGRTISAPPRMSFGSDQYSICNNLTIAKGRDISYLDIERYNQVMVLGKNAAETFFGTMDPIGKVMQVNGQAFTVIGVYAPRATGENVDYMLDNIIVFPYTSRRAIGGDMMTEFIIKAKDSQSVSQVITRVGGFLKGLIPEGTGGYSVYSQSQWQESENQYLNMIGLVLGGIAAISLLVGGIGIMNIMLVTVTERTREIGIRRAIGAKRSSIVAQFLIEAGMLCGFGGILGILVGMVLSYVLGKLIFHMTIYPVLWVTLSAFGLSVLLGMIFGSYPAVKASKLQPVEALRSE